MKALISALHVGEINCGSKVRGFSGIPRKFSPIPRFLGTGMGTGILGNLDWGFLGINPENPQISGTRTGLHLSKGSGTGRGQGQPKFWGFWGEKSPKIGDFRGGDWGNNLGDFPLTTTSSPQNRIMALASTYIYPLEP